VLENFYINVEILTTNAAFAFTEGESFFSHISAVIFVSNEYNGNNINENLHNLLLHNLLKDTWKLVHERRSHFLVC